MFSWPRLFSSLFIMLALVLVLATAMLIVFYGFVSTEPLRDTLALAGVVTALVSAGWSHYNRSVELANKKEEIEVTQRHQLTKEIFSELLTQKIKMYQNLSKIIQNRNEDIRRPKTIDIENEEGLDGERIEEAYEVQYRSLEEIIGELLANRTIVTREVFNKFEFLAAEKDRIFCAYDDAERDGSLEQNDLVDTRENIKQKFIENNQKRIDELYDLLESEMDKIRLKLEVL